MRRQSLFTLTLTSGVAVILLLGVSAPRPRITPSQASVVTDAAFRDGLFQAKLDIESGRQAHFASGRWNSNADRALFIAGYQQGYRELSESSSGNLAKANAAELEGFRDGMLDGAAHRRASQPFQVGKTENYRAAGQGHLAGNVDPKNYTRDYRRAYSNGYQWGYYSQPDQEESKALSEKSRGF